MRDLATVGPWVAAALAGCATGPNEETVIDELRVVAAIAEPPEVAPGEPFDLDVTVADPVGDGFDLLVWSCPPAEAPAGVAPPEALGGACVVSRPEVLGDHAVVPSVGLSPVPQWVLACAPGACDLSDPREAELRDPAAWLGTLPLEGVSAALRQVRIVQPPAEPTLQNPVVDELSGVRRLGAATPDAPVTLRFRAVGARTAYGRSTVGGFARPSFDVAEDGTVALDWYGPRKREAGPGTIYVVFEGVHGAAALAEVPVP